MVASTECALRTALQWLAEVGPAGITIAALFGRLKGELDIDEATASAVWEDLKTKDYITCRLGDGELRRLSSSPLGKLELSELALVGLGSKQIFHNPGQLLGKRKASTELASPPTKRRSISPAADPPDISASTPKISDQAPAITSSDESSPPSRVLSADTPADPSTMASSNPGNGSHSSDESSSSLRKLPPKAYSIPAAVSPSTPAKDLPPASSPTSSIDSAPQGTLSNPSLQTAHQPDVPAQPTTNIEPISTTSANTWHTLFHGPRPYMSRREIGRGAAARFPQAIIKTSRGGGLRRPMFPEFAPVRTYISPYSRPVALQHSPPPLANTPTVLLADSYVAPPSTFAEATHTQSDFGQPHSPPANSFMSQSIGPSTQTPVAQYNYSYDLPANVVMSQSTDLFTQAPLGQQSHFYAPPPNASESQSIGFSTQAPVAQYEQVSAYPAASAEQHVSPYVQIPPYANGSAQQRIPTPSTIPSQQFIPPQAFGSNDQKLWNEALVPQTIQQSAQSPPPSISGPKTRKPRKRRSPQKKSQQARKHHVEDEGNRMEINFEGQLQDLDSGRKRTISEADSQGTPNQKRQRISENISQAQPVSQAKRLVLPEYVAALSCIWSGTRGHLVLLEDQSSLEFYSLDEPSPNAPMIALPIRNLTENPILSTPGSDPMEIHIKANDSRGEEVTFRFAFDFTDGKGVALPDIMVQYVRSAIVSVRFGQNSDLPRVDNVEDEFGSNDDLDFAVPNVKKSEKAGPTASQPKDSNIHQNFEKPDFPRVETAQNPEGHLHANVETTGLPSAGAAENFDPEHLQPPARETQPGATKGKQVKKVKEVKAKKPKTTYTCSKCGNTYLQSWGLSYHLNKSNTPCNPNADLTLYEAKKARREKRNISKKLRRSMTQNEDSETELQGQQADLKSTSRPQMQFQGAADNIESIKSRPKRERKPKKQFAGVVTIPSETFQPSAASGHQIDQSPSTPTAEPNETPKKRATSKQAAHTELEEAEQSDSSASSVDSAVEFYQAHAITGVERPRKVTFADHPTTTPSKKSKALPFENYVLQEIAAQMAVAPPSAEPSAPSQSAETAIASSSAVEASSVVEPSSAVESSSVVEPSSAVEASSVVESSSIVEPSDVVESINTKASAMMLCEDILISLVRDNEGFFPGDKSIWIAFINVWFRTRKPQTTSMLPMSTLCIEGVLLLVEKKKLRSEHFTWIDSKKREVTRTILTSPNFDVSSEHIDALKMLFQQFHPNLYVPARFAPPEPILTRLNELATRKVPVADRERFRLLKSAPVESDSESEVQSPIQLEDETSEDEFIAGGIDEEEVEELDQLQDDMVELDGSKKKRSRKPTRKRTRDGEKLSRPRDQRHNKAISEGVRRNWALRKAAQTKDFFPSRKMARARKPISQEEKDRRAETAYYNRRAWDFQTPAFMPNPETGAWDVDAKPLKSKRGGTRHMKPKIPHPITYMQAPDGAWSFQPAGHGAKPVFARPLRRADEEGSYLKRTNRTHRPVIFPTKNRKFLPANPSKKLLGQPLASKRRVSTDASKIKRKPKRKSTRKNPVASRRTSARSRVSKNAKKKKVRPNNDIFPVFIPTHAVETKRKKKDKIVVNEADILNFFEPKKLLPNAPRNVGLASIPQAFGLLASLYQGPDVAVHQYRPDYHNLVFVEPKPITGGERPSTGSWTVGIWRPIQSGSVSLRWDEATAVDMETVPYSKLDFGRDDEIHDKRPGPKRGSQRYKLVPIENITMEQRFKYTRVLTALPNDLKGLIKDPQDAIKKLGVELAKPNRATESNRRIKGSNAILSKKAEFRLIITVVIVRALTGGLDCRIDWVIVSQLFQDYTCNFLMKFWKTLQIPKRELIECVHEDFRKVFVQAYKNSEVPSINYDRLSDYQWATLVNWVMTHKDINTSLVKQRKPLSSSRIRVGKQFDVKPVPKDLKLKPWREADHKEGTANYLRVQMATSEPRVVRSIDRKKTFEALFSDEFRLLRSWIRATALTPAWDYDSKVAQKKLLSIATKEVIKETLATLQEQKVLLKSSRVRRFFGCIFEVGSAFLTPLTKMDLNVEQFIDAATAKSHLDDSFRASGRSVKHEYLATVGNLVAVTSMQAHQRIRLDASRWPSEGKKFGMNEDGGYETRKIDPVKYIFDITIEPVPNKYVYDSDNAEIARFLMAEPPLGPSTGELPIWRGITGKLNRDIWKRVLAAVGSLVGNRAGLNIRTLMEHFSPTFEAWELRTLMDWGVENGLFKVVQPGIEGWTVTEWWWLAIGKKCDDGIPLGRGK